MAKQYKGIVLGYNTSEEWFDMLEKPNDTVILNPDGWDRSSPDAFAHSWGRELITKEEFYSRLAQSTCSISLDRIRQQLG